MSVKGAYGLVPSSASEQQQLDAIEANDRTNVDTNGDAPHPGDLEPLEVDELSSSNEGGEQPAVMPFGSKSVAYCTMHDTPTALWLLSTLALIFLTIPTLVGLMWIVWDMLGLAWPLSGIAIHLAADLLASQEHRPIRNQASLEDFTARRERCCGIGNSCSWLIVPCIDIALFVVVYPLIFNLIIESTLTEPDGTIVIEYSGMQQRIVTFLMLGRIVAIMRAIILAFNLCLVLSNVNTTLRTAAERTRAMLDFFELGSDQLKRFHCVVVSPLKLFSVGFALWCLGSLGKHWIHWPAPRVTGLHDVYCDPIDQTECAFPFPSMYYLEKDQTTETGWRVNLHGASLPPLKNGLKIQPDVWNKLDGFSTMAPMLFYMEGLKEAHEKGSGTARLQGIANIALSVTQRSLTLLFDVQRKMLVPHIAEIDYLDGGHPLVMVHPAKPLHHNTHYALAVVNATDVHGRRFPPTHGLSTVLATMTLSSKQDQQSDLGKYDRSVRYHTQLIPALAQAAPWFDYVEDPQSLQLLFDFHTVSAESQIGPAREVRDATMNYIQGPKWGPWNDHVQVVKQTDHTCSSGNFLARTVHAQMDMPWFLEGFGAGQREATMDYDALSKGEPKIIGKAKFIVGVPCSLKAAALGNSIVHLGAIVELGHGLFYNRNEVLEDYFVRMAHDSGYLIMAMDWRGMSQFDFLVVSKVLLKQPSKFEAIRDNLIQGYANKLALQHFSKNGMGSMEWLQFEDEAGTLHPIPIEGDAPVSAYYGFSQGGILGAGYTALSGSTGLIDRSVLGVPGTPFSLILTRSLKFLGYDHLLLKNIYQNRHVRFIITLCQMLWDSVEASGHLASPLTDPVPRVLLQAGLGDEIVPTAAAEALSRAFGAQTLPGNPRTIYGIPVGKPSNATYQGPKSTLTELLYMREYDATRVKDISGKANAIHWCIREDHALIRQASAFIDTGNIIDPCTVDRCIRQSAHC